MVLRVSRGLCLTTAIVVALTALVHAFLHPGEMGKDALRLHQYLVFYLVAVWLVSDPKLPKADRPSFDHAYLHMAFFPFTALYEQVAAHGWRGLVRLLGLGLVVLATVVADLVASR